MEIKFKRNFKLVDNGDLTQNLHSLCYQNNILISETDLGNVEDILVQLKKQKEINDKVRKLFEECKMLSPHEFNWEEQVDNVLNILNEE